MSMHKTELDKLLREFLESNAELRNRGITLESVDRTTRIIADEVLSLRKEVNDLHRDMLNVKTAQAVADARPRMPSAEEIIEEVTGSHEIKELHEMVKEKRDSMIWWKRKRWEWAIAAFGATLTIIIAQVLAYFITISRK